MINKKKRHSLYRNTRQTQTLIIHYNMNVAVLLLVEYQSGYKHKRVDFSLLQKCVGVKPAV